MPPRIRFEEHFILISFPHSEDRFRFLLESGILPPALPFDPLTIEREFDVGTLSTATVSHYDPRSKLLSVTSAFGSEELTVKLTVKEVYRALRFFPGVPRPCQRSWIRDHTGILGMSQPPLYLLNPSMNDDIHDWHRPLFYNSEIAQLIARKFIQPACGNEWSHEFGQQAKWFVVHHLNVYKAQHHGKEPPLRRLIEILGDNPFFQMQTIHTYGQPLNELRRGQRLESGVHDTLLVTARPMTEAVNAPLGSAGGPFHLRVLDPRRGGRMSERIIFLDHKQKLWVDPYDMGSNKDAKLILGSPYSFLESGIDEFGKPISVKRKSDPTNL